MFQSTLPRGERLYEGDILECVSWFQSTLPRGERPTPTSSSPSVIRFNPRSHEGSDQFEALQHEAGRRFNPRSHEGSDRSTNTHWTHALSFNPRSHEGSDPWRTLPARLRPVSIHAPTRGATWSGLNVAGQEVFQSTLPRGERLDKGQHLRLFIVVSIHAPTRGATFCFETFIKDTVVSIHAPTRGATLSPIGISRPVSCFNPRSHEGSDWRRVSRCSPGGRFNPRSHEGSDQQVSTSLANYYLFQSTLPRGERQGNVPPTATQTSLFQSTLPRGERRQDDDGCSFCSEFQSTLPRGERRRHASFVALALLVSIHAPTRGATHRQRRRHHLPRVSIHAPTRGATELMAQGNAIQLFQSTLPRGERLSICTLLTYRSVYAAFRDVLFMEKIVMREKRFVKGNSLILN